MVAALLGLLALLVGGGAIFDEVEGRLRSEADDLDPDDFDTGDVQVAGGETDGGTPVDLAESLGPVTLLGTEILIDAGEDTEPLAWDSDTPEIPDTQGFLDLYETETGLELETREDFRDFVELGIANDLFDALLFGSSDPEVLTGGDDDEAAIGFEGNDTIFLGGGEYVVLGVFANESAGDDSIRGGRGPDLLVDHMGENTLRGDGESDFLDARDMPLEPGADFVIGGVGADTLLGDGADTLAGGPGGDLFQVYVTEEATDADAVEVSDFSASEDALEILIETDTPQRAGDYTLDIIDRLAETGASEVRVDGRLVARLVGSDGAGLSVVVGNYRVT